MSKNKLYHLISDLVHTQNAISFKQNKNAKDVLYYLTELPMDKKIRVGQYALTSHHISVYEAATSTSILDQKSQYHYTAYFDGDDGKKYRLHVFYDMCDNIIQQPLLSEMGEDNTFSPVSSRDEENAFSLLANLSIKRTIAMLRQQQAVKLQALHDQYNELEGQAELLSVDLVKNKKTFITLLDAQLLKLEEIIHYSNNPKTSSDIKRFLTKLKKSVVELEDLPVVAVNPPVVKVVKSKSEKKKPGYKPPAAKTAKPKSSAKKAQKSEHSLKLQQDKLNFKKVLEDFRSRFEKRSASHENDLPTLFTNLYSDIIQKECELDFGLADAAVGDLRGLASLKDSVARAGANLLQRLLIQGNYRHAETMACFYSELSENLLHFTLSSHKVSLLQFMLNNNLVSVDYKNFMIRNVSFTSMIDFCFKSEANESLRNDMLRVLIEHGASLMEIEVGSGLPFAALILLEKTKLKIDIPDPNFYRKLNKVLELLCQQPECLSDNLGAMLRLIKLNESTIRSLEAKKLLDLSAVENAQNEIVMQASKMMGDDIVMQLQSDPYIKVMQARVNERLMDLLPLLKREQLDSVKKKLILNMDAIKKALNDSVDVSSLISFSDIKEQVLKQNINALRTIDLTIELLGLQSRLAVSNGLTNSFFKNSQVKEHQRMVREERRLVSEIRAITEELNEPFTFLNNYQSLMGEFSDLIGSLNAALSALDEIKNLLPSGGLFAQDDQTPDDQPRNVEKELEQICKTYGNF